MSPHGHFSQIRGTVSAQQGPKPFCRDGSGKSRAQTGTTPSTRFFGINLFAGRRPQNLNGFWRVVAQSLSGSVALALLTVVCFRLQLNLATTACLYLIIIVLLSLLGSLLSAAVVSLIAVGCLAYYFAPPTFSFRVSDPLNVAAIAAFWIASAVISGLVYRVRRLAEGALSEIEDRTRAEDALKRSEAYLAHAQQLTKAGSWAYERDDTCEYWSAEMFRIFGLDPLNEHPSSDRFLSLVHAEDRQRVEEAFTQHSLQGGTFDLKYRIVRSDGQIRVIRDFGAAIFEDGVVTRSVGACVDVTEQENLTQELQRREAYLAEAQRLSDTGSFGWRVSTGEKHWSAETFRIFQYDRRTKPTMELVVQRIHPEDVAHAKQTFERASQDGKDFDLEYRLVMPDGSVKHVHVVAHAVRDKSGEVEFVGAVMDVTAAKRAEEALRQSEEQWRDVFENNPTMYFMVDATGKVIAVNPFGAEQLGYKVDELVGQPVVGVFYEVDREAARRNVALCLEQIGRAKSWEARKVRKDGTVLSVRETAKAVPRVNGPIVLIACEDITEHKRAEEALRQAQADLEQVNRVTTMGELTASLAHEVNQPIAAAVTNANTCLRWLAGHTPNLKEARAAAMRIVKDGTRAGEIISRIRLLFKKGTPQRELVDLNEVIREMIVLLRSEAMRYSISVRTELAADLPQVLGDRVQLQQVLMNLIMNSIDAMKDVEGTRELGIKSQHSENEHLLVSVSDTGVGLPPRHADQIFNAFFTTKPDGTGMGLRISRSIVESHGGRLWAANNSPRGASFYLTLPAKPEARE